MRKTGLARLALAAAMAAALAGPAAAFDARHPADFTALVTAHGASGALKSRDGEPYFDGQASDFLFEIHFQDCDDAKALCRSLLFVGAWGGHDLSAEQINRWNRLTVYCPAYLDTGGSPVMWYPLSVSAATSSQDVTDDVSVWMSCLKDFDNFTSAPDDFLKRAGDSGPTTPPPAGAPPTAAGAAPRPH